MSTPTRSPADPAVFLAVYTIMAAHSPLAKPLTAKGINARLPPHLVRCEGAIRHHMRNVWKSHKPINVASIPRPLVTAHYPRTAATLCSGVDFSEAS